MSYRKTRILTPSSRRRIERTIDAVITATAMALIITGVAFAGYVVGKRVVAERSSEKPAVEVTAGVAFDSAPRAVEIEPVVLLAGYEARAEAAMLPAEIEVSEETEMPSTEIEVSEEIEVRPGHTFSRDEVDATARMVYGEARNCGVMEQAATVWCALNRVDSDDPYFPDTLLEVLEQPYQFAGYKESNPVLPELAELVEDVFVRWSAERSGIESVGRVLPREYLFFSGDGNSNCFTLTYAGGDVWDWSLYNPYTE